MVFVSARTITFGTYFGKRVAGYSTVGSLNINTLTEVCFQLPVVTMNTAFFADSIDLKPIVTAIGGTICTNPPISRSLREISVSAFRCTILVFEFAYSSTVIS